MAVLITGAAGFIGAHAVEAKRRAGHRVVATDAVAERDAIRLKAAIACGVTYICGDLADVASDVMPDVEEVWHFAANADIPLGARDTAIDIRESVLLTQTLLEAMRAHRTQRLVYPSTSGVYGSAQTCSLPETTGPLLPNSLHAAGKLAAEGLISAYCSTFGLQSKVFRLGNVLGGGMQRGIVRDFVRKLMNNPTELAVLGDGRQRKSYVLVDDAIAAMCHMTVSWKHAPPCEVFNIAAGGTLTVAEVAAAVAAAMRIDAPRLITESTALAWPGDQPVIELDIGKALETGWCPKHSAFQSVTIAAERLLRGLQVEAMT